MITQTLLFSMIYSLLLSLVIYTVYYKLHKKEGVNDMYLTLLLLPLVVCAIIYTIGENVAGAFSLAGIFTIVRFRSTQASPKDITYILMAVSAGLIGATHFYKEGILLVIFCVIIILLFEKTQTKNYGHQLRILVPEDLLDTDDIDDIIAKYSSNFYLRDIETKDLGSLFQLKYFVSLSDLSHQQKLIDELRVVNGNLTIAISNKGGF